MRVGVPRELREGERRVALVPEVAGTLASAGHEVLVEAGAGEGAHIPDAAFEAAGCRVVDAAEVREVDVLLKVLAPTADELALLPAGICLVAHLDPLGNARGIAALAEQGVDACAVELVPRITRAQPMDALSSQATVAGYKAAIVAASQLGRFFPLLMTAAGTVPPAKVLILGAGVAGLQAIATSRRLGAVVTAFDVRPAVKEQVESLGARFLELELETHDAETAGGYAKALDEDTHRMEQELIAKAVAEADVVITTALIPGRPAPVLITEDAVAGMRPGSVIVDLAAEAGGNCELTEAGRQVDRHGVLVLGPRNLPASMPQHASQLYAKNLVSLLGTLAPEGTLDLERDDEIVQGVVVSRGGAVTNERVKAALEAGGVA